MMTNTRTPEWSYELSEAMKEGFNSRDDARTINKENYLKGRVVCKLHKITRCQHCTHKAFLLSEK